MTTTTTTTFERRRAGGSAIAGAAWAMVAGAVLMVVLGIPLAALQAAEPPLWPAAALNAVSHLLLLAGVAGLARSGVAGRGRLAALGLALTLLGLAVLTLAEAVWVRAGEDSAGAFYSTATLALLLGLLLAGGAVVRAGRWRGWRRYTVLATGLFIPLGLLPAFALPGVRLPLRARPVGPLLAVGGAVAGGGGHPGVVTTADRPPAGRRGDERRVGAYAGTTKSYFATSRANSAVPGNAPERMAPASSRR